MPDKDSNQRVEFWLPNELAEAMDEARGPVARSEFIRNAIQRAIEDGVTGSLRAES